MIWVYRYFLKLLRLSSLCALFLCVGCIRRPGVGAKSATFTAKIDHSSSLVTRSTCGSCHLAKLPTGTVGSSPKFNHTGNIGSNDCRVCHTTQIGVSWAGGQFPHLPFPSTCLNCHSSAEWPGGTGPFTGLNGMNIPSFNHVIQGVGDCAACHQEALQNLGTPNARKSWANSGLWFPSQLASVSDPDPLSLDYTVAVQIPVWGGATGTSMTRAISSNFSLPQTMNHQSVEVSEALLFSCVTCHSDASSGAFRPGAYHGSILNVPKTCGDCHGSGVLWETGLPTSGVPQGLVGPLGASRTPSSGEMNHGARVWSLQNTRWSRTSAPAFNQDCSVCHFTPGNNPVNPSVNTWGGAQFHARLGTSQPSTCLDCHANNRPGVSKGPVNSTLAPTSFDHAQGMGDCGQCHAVSTPLSWNPGIFHLNSGSLTQCSSCHEGQRPTSSAITTGWKGFGSPISASSSPFDTTQHFSGTDCIACHSPNTFSSMLGWGSGFYAHSKGLQTCLPCHSVPAPVPPSPAWYPATTVDHTPGSDCVGCHTAALSNVILQGANPKNSAWQGTGLGGATTVPSGPVGNQTLNPGQVTQLVMSLNRVVSVSTSSTISMPLDILHSNINTPSLSCNSCHTGTKLLSGINQGYFHQSLTAKNLIQPSVCYPCHSNMFTSLTQGTVMGPANRNMNHWALLPNGHTIFGNPPDTDCATCHGDPGSAKGFLNSGYFHGKVTGVTSATACVSCHYLDVQGIYNQVTQKMNHSSSQVTGDCGTCHSPPASMVTSPSASLWGSSTSLTRFHSNVVIQPMACDDCHSPQRPTVTTKSPIDATVPSSYMNHSSSAAAGDCAICHLNEVKNLAANTSPSAFSKTDSFHTSVTSGVTTCNECHGIANGLAVTSNSIPVGPTVTSNVSLSASSGIIPYFGSLPVYDLINHADANVSGECKNCHSVPLANAGPAYSVWKGAKFHSHVTSLGGSCANCHYNSMPNDNFTGFIHSGLISASGTVVVPRPPAASLQLTQDCSGCHSYPGAGGTTAPNWLGAVAGAPGIVNVGGFTIPMPPAGNTQTVEPSIPNFPHPMSLTTCSACHNTPSSKKLIGYAHSNSAKISKSCNACHEYGSNIVGTPWPSTGTGTGGTTGAGTGDTRPVPLVTLSGTMNGKTCSIPNAGNRYGPHWYPIDCSACHTISKADMSAIITFSAKTPSKWTFDHGTFYNSGNGSSKTASPACAACHSNGCN